MKWWEAGILALVGLVLLKGSDSPEAHPEDVSTSGPGGPALAAPRPVSSPGPGAVAVDDPASVISSGPVPAVAPARAYWAAVHEALEDGDCCALSELVADGPPG